MSLLNKRKRVGLSRWVVSGIGVFMLSVSMSLSFAGDVTKGLVHYWPCDGDPESIVIKDVIGEQNGRLIRGATLVKEPLVNPKFDTYSIFIPGGTENPAVKISTSKNFAVKSGFTITGWINMGTGAKYATLAGNYPGGPPQPGYFRIALETWKDGSHAIRFEATNDLREDLQVLAPYSWGCEMWHHVVATVSLTEAKVYVDGEDVVTKPVDFMEDAVWLGHPSLQLMLGAINIDWHKRLEEEPDTIVEGKHYIGNIRIYNRSLSASEIEEIYLFELERKKDSK